MLDILNCSPIAQFAIDQDKKITLWNRACERLTGLPAEQMVGSKNQWKPFYSKRRPVLADLIVDGDKDGLEQLYLSKDVSRSEIIPDAWEARDLFKNIGGRDRHLYFIAAPLCDAQGRITGAIETVQDITKQVLSAKDLQESEQRYRTLTEQVADGVALLQDGRLKLVNNAFCSIFGYSPEEDLVTRKAIDFVSPEDRPLYMEMDEAFEEGGFNTDAVELRCLNAQGIDFWVESHNNVITWQGKPAVLVTIRDISDRKAKELVVQEEAQRLKKENSRLKKKVRNRYGLGQLIGNCRPMQAVYEHIMKASTSNANVIVYGESGTGKDLVARAIHEMSDRAEKGFIAVNCGAIPENLFESEFFGHKKGAFTGASIDKSGYLESADGGTLFLDEIGEIPLNMQVKLLRAIEGAGFTPIGSTRVKKSDARIIAATNRDLKDLVKRGLMREDFFYRIHIIPIQVPPLRERREDIPLLAYHFMQMHGRNETESFLPDKTLKAMQAYAWPGNVRELQNVIQRYVTFNTLDFISLEDGNADHPDSDKEETSQNIKKGFRLRTVLEKLEKRFLTTAMDQESGNRTRAALTLGIERKSLQRKLKKYQLA